MCLYGGDDSVEFSWKNWVKFSDTEISKINMLISEPFILNYGVNKYYPQYIEIKRGLGYSYSIQIFRISEYRSLEILKSPDFKRPPDFQKSLVYFSLKYFTISLSL